MLVRCPPLLERDQKPGFAVLRFWTYLSDAEKEHMPNCERRFYPTQDATESDRRAMGRRSATHHHCLTEGADARPTSISVRSSTRFAPTIAPLANNNGFRLMLRR